MRQGKDTYLGGSDPTFQPFGLQSNPWGRSRPPALLIAPRVFALSPQRDKKGGRTSANRSEGTNHREARNPSNSPSMSCSMTMRSSSRAGRTVIQCWKTSGPVSAPSLATRKAGAQ